LEQRRARRALWAFRLTFYPATIVVALLHHYRSRDQTGRRTITLDAQMEDNTVAGTVTAVEHFVEPGYGRYTCESGPIRFAAGTR
jgi:hypothetical protein